MDVILKHSMVINQSMNKEFSRTDKQKYAKLQMTTIQRPNNSDSSSIYNSVNK